MGGDAGQSVVIYESRCLGGGIIIGVIGWARIPSWKQNGAAGALFQQIAGKAQGFCARPDRLG